MKWTQVKSDLKELLLSSTELEGDGFVDRANLLIAFGDRLAASGWNRRRIYECMCELINELSHEIPSRAFDMLDGYISALTGDVSSDCIVRFPGEPEDDGELLKYVRGRSWMNLPRGEDLE